MAFFRRKFPAGPALPLSQRQPARPIAIPATDPFAAPPSSAARPAPAPPTEAPVASTHGPLRVLVICTANICRSPLGQALLHRAFLDAGIAATVTSAGVRAVRRAPDPRSVAYAARFGVDLAAHEARQLDPSILATDGADLVVAMTREHLREAVVLDPGSIRRAFTLRELARRVDSTNRGLGEDVGEWVQRLGAERRPADLLGEASADDVPDPFGRSDAMFADVAAEIEQLTRKVAHAVADAVAEHG